jgi:hypothetical protein
LPPANDMIGAMRSVLISVGRLVKKFTTPSRQSQLNRSRLVGMYLFQANSKEAFSSEIQQSRQRRNSKYSHTRERA